MLTIGGRRETTTGRDTRLVLWKPSCARSRKTRRPLGSVSARKRCSISVRPTARPFHERPRSFENCSENSSVPWPRACHVASSLAAVDGHREAPDDRRPFGGIARPDGLARSASFGTLDDAETGAGRHVRHHRLEDERTGGRIARAASAPAAVRGQTHHRRGGEHLSLGAEQLRHIRRRSRTPCGGERLQSRDALHLERAGVVDRPEDGNDRLGLHSEISRAAIPAGRIGDVLPWPQVRIDEVRRLPVLHTDAPWIEGIVVGKLRVVIERDPHRSAVGHVVLLGRRMDGAVRDVETVLAERGGRAVGRIVRLIGRIARVDGRIRHERERGIAPRHEEEARQPARRVLELGAVPDLVGHRHLVRVPAGADTVQLAAGDGAHRHVRR